ncbi:hypothetical protein CC80DRAFT_529372 [Byssothecium circinans]|uniref:Restriction endonuclease type IV Mrr domain-containing protein n=1 Tax=Byssothecium circinans TaxID=147558 RepID=A0A6A5TCW6_9PLEO|nr:hypothetical protein CC80DRAFT_529372 [Byssothecium circinans]
MRSLRPSCFKQPLSPVPLHRLPRTPPQTLIPRRIVTTSTSNTAPIDVPKLIVSPGSTHHNSLSTFLTYAERKNLNKASTVYVGTLYEYTAAVSLLRLGFSLLRTGRKSDAGIDLIGHWVLPPFREPIPVIVQCKGTKYNSAPTHIRELEGSFSNVPPEWKSRNDVLGLFVTAHNATSGVLHTISTSRRPLAFVKITPDGTVEQLLWNHAASERGLEGVGVTLRHTPRVLLPAPSEWGPNPSSKTTRARSQRLKALKKFRAEGTKKDVRLTWLGSPISAEREALDDETTKLVKTIEGAEDVTPPGAKNTVKGVRNASSEGKQKRQMQKYVSRPRFSESGKRLGRPPGAKNKKAVGGEKTAESPPPMTESKSGSEMQRVPEKG